MAKSSVHPQTVQSKEVFNLTCFTVFFSIGHPYLIGLWLGEDQRTNTIKTHV
jgi:hypothetical protein